MKLLFIHRAFPGQFRHIVQALAAARHQVVFITQAGDSRIEGVIKVAYAVTPGSHRTHPAAQDFDAAQRRAQAVAEAAAGLRAAGFTPDLVIGHEAWGEMLHVADIWPAAPRIAYREYFYHLAGADIGFDPEFPLLPGQAAAVRAKNAVNLLGLHGTRQGVSPTLWQRGLYPAWAQPDIALVPDGVDLDVCRPDPAARLAPFSLGATRIPPVVPVLSFVARNLEPYRGFHTLMRSLPGIMAQTDAHIVCAGGDGVSYGAAPPQGTWRQRLLAEISAAIDPIRLHFPGRVDYADYIRLLQRSDVHAYLSHPFIASWSLREALACGCAVVATDTAPVREFISGGVNGLLAPSLDPAAVANAVCGLFQHAGQRAALGWTARSRAEQEMRLESHVAAWTTVIHQRIGR